MNTLFQKMRNNRRIAAARQAKAQRQQAISSTPVEQTIAAAIERSRSEKIVREREQLAQQRWYRNSAWFKGDSK